MLNINRKIIANSFSNNISIFYLTIENRIVKKIKYILYIVDYNITSFFVFISNKQTNIFNIHN